MLSSQLVASFEAFAASRTIEVVHLLLPRRLAIAVL